MVSFGIPDAVTVAEPRTANLAVAVSVHGYTGAVLLDGAGAVIAASRFPDLAEARLTVEGREYATPAFRRTEWCLLEPIRFGQKEVGTVEVCYRERPPIREDELFLPEEQNLLQQLSEKISEMVQRRHTEEQLRQAQKMKAVGRLAGAVAHDLNNLLTVIKGRAQFGVEDLKESDPFRKDILEILEAADRAQNLTRQLLAFSRQLVATPRVVEASALLRTAEKMLQRLIGEDVELNVTASAELGRVRVDPTQLDQVLMNLTINARDAMPGGGRLSIRAENVDTLELPLEGRGEPFKPGRYVRIQLTDTGAGMDPETQRKIFEPFFTTKPPGRGTGLGLSTVFGIVKQSGGFIRVASEEGVGSTFEVYLPRTDAEPEPRSMHPLGAPVAAGSGTILVVEDNAAVRSVLHRSLERAGYRVCEAANGNEALAIWGWQSADIDLVLTDMVMPHVWGAELASRLRADRPDLPIILMSGYTEDAVLQRSKLEPGIERLEKPFEAGELQQKIRDVLNASGLTVWAPPAIYPPADLAGRGLPSES